MIKQALMQQLKNAVIASPHIAVFHTEVTASTNDWAWHYFGEQSAEFGTPTLFIASQQLRGKGTQGRQWHSPQGTGLYMTLLEPFPENTTVIFGSNTQFEREYLTQGQGFTKAAGVATILTLTALYPWLKGYIGIRKVNDIFLNHRKLGGILVESKLRANGRTRAVITGLGLNVIHNELLIIKDARNAAISLEEYAKELGIVVEWMSPAELGFLIAKHILALYSLLQNGQVEDIEALWQEYSLVEF
jgi:biotin-(acetyl-CoA carboxylase) ligase